MYLDAFTLSALVDEFMDTLVGGRIQDSVSVDDTGIGLEIYADRRRRYLYISADSRTPRIHVVPDKLRRGVQRPSQLALLIRRYVEGGVLVHVSQPSWERIIQLDIDGQEGSVTLIVEPMERRSNILLVADGIVLDCLRRVGSDENRYRVSLPAHPYQLPPPQQDKIDPFALTLPQLIGLYQTNDDPKRKTHQLLTARVLGVSPLLAREVVYRAFGAGDRKLNAEDAPALHTAFVEALAPLKARDWQPGLASDGDSISAFSVYPLRHRPGWQPVESTSEAIARFYSATVGEDAYNAGKAVIRTALDEARAKMRAKLESLKRSMTDDSEREHMRQSGELILAYQYAIAEGQTVLQAQYDFDAPTLTIAIDPTMTPLENAQRYFDKYNRAKRALDDVPRLIDETTAELAWLDQLGADLDLASNWPEIDEVTTALHQKGYWRGKAPARSGASKSAPLRVVTPDGYVIWIGRNSRQNEQVTFDKGSPMDFWLHARGVPGSHVIIKYDGRAIPDDVIERAAQYAAYYSNSRADAKVSVDVTERRHVKKIKGAAVGMVTYREETTRVVSPRSARDADT